MIPSEQSVNTMALPFSRSGNYNWTFSSWQPRAKHRELSENNYTKK